MGATKYRSFVRAKPIEDGDLTFPLTIKFDKPYPTKCEMVDFLMLGSQYAVSEKFKILMENKNIFGVQFFPIEIEPNKGDTIFGHYAMHWWNQYQAIDKKNYEEGKKWMSLDLSIYWINFYWMIKYWKKSLWKKEN